LFLSIQSSFAIIEKKVPDKTVGSQMQ